MNLTRFEVGIVSADDTLVDFYADVFGLEKELPKETSVGRLHRLQSAGAGIKVMVPHEPPQPAGGVPHLAVTGISYLTMWVTDFDGVLQRCTTHGGGVVAGPIEHEGARLAVITDPIGNTIEVLEPAS